MGRKFRLLLAAGTVALAAIVATTALAQTHARGAEPFKIALSNSFIGNKWRIEMENAFKAACAMPPYKDQVDCTVYNSGNDVAQADAADLEPDLRRTSTRSSSTPRPRTGLNGVVQQACAAQDPRRLVRQHRDRAVRAQGQHRPVRVRPAARAVPRRQAQGQGQRDHGHGRRRHQARHRPQQGRAWRSSRRTRASRWSASYTGMWDSATAQRNTAAQLPSLPKVDGIWASGRHRRRHQGVHRRQAAAAAGRGGEARERLPQVHAGYQARSSSTACRSASRRSSSWSRSSWPGRCSRAAAPRGQSRSRSRRSTEETVKEGETVFTDHAGQLLRRLHRLRPERHREDLRGGARSPASRAPGRSRSTSRGTTTRPAAT